MGRFEPNDPYMFRKYMSFVIFNALRREQNFRILLNSMFLKFVPVDPIGTINNTNNSDGRECKRVFVH